MQRFAFGRNWLRYARELPLSAIEAATKDLAERLPNLTGKRFLDIGSGSGIHSLAAQRLGAVVHSFDYDADSVECTRALKRAHGAETPAWTIERGSALDLPYLKSLGTFDVVYSWGVLHHTGDLRQALENAVAPVKAGGTLFVSIYNDQGWRSQYWIAIKRAYNSSRIMRAIVLTTHLPLPFARFIVRKLRRRPLERGMSIWSDHIDWLGGYPFEVASFEAMQTFYETRGFRLMSSTRATSGCNEFVFERRQQ